MCEGAVEVFLFGALAGRFGATSAHRPARRQIAAGPTGSIQDVLAALGVTVEEVGHLFLNGQYSGPERGVKPGDRLAVFGRDMALIYRQYFPKVRDPA
jgi:hypothetical protein